MDKVEIGLFTLFNHDPSHFISKTENPSSSKVLEVLNSPVWLEFSGWGGHRELKGRVRDRKEQFVP